LELQLGDNKACLGPLYALVGAARGALASSLAISDIAVVGQILQRPLGADWDIMFL